MTLEHDLPNCRGHWKHQLIGKHLYWRCKGCGATAYHSDAVADAAILENCLGTVLRQLIEAGRLILEQEREQ